MFHNPRPEILERLNERHIGIFRTDKMGVVTFLLDGKNVSAATAVK